MSHAHDWIESDQASRVHGRTAWMGSNYCETNLLKHAGTPNMILRQMKASKAKRHMT